MTSEYRNDGLRRLTKQPAGCTVAEHSRVESIYLWSLRAGHRLSAVIAAVLLIGSVAAWHHARPQLRIRSLGRMLAEEGRRPVGGRLSGFAYAAEPRRNRAPNDDLAGRLIAAKATAVARDYAESSRAAELHAAGISLLIAGRPRDAVVTIERAASLSPDDVRGWSDLAAARLAWYDAEGAAPQLIAGLRDADRALRLVPDRAEPLLNRARILEAMWLYAAAADAYRSFLTVEATTPWATEARNRRLHLLKRTRVEQGEHAAKQIRIAAAANDRAGVRAAVAAFPQDVRANGETTWLTDGHPQRCRTTTTRPIRRWGWQLSLAKSWRDSTAKRCFAMQRRRFAGTGLRQRSESIRRS